MTVCLPVPKSRGMGEPPTTERASWESRPNYLDTYGSAAWAPFSAASAATQGACSRVIHEETATHLGSPRNHSARGLVKGKYRWPARQPNPTSALLDSHEPLRPTTSCSLLCNRCATLVSGCWTKPSARTAQP
ncbi:predicted protein [Chaetomium globosum CBS 148.51]|uniref:Uncharacterized protein n=1 Tax=Chaetomium globosum (strain ATCC 6205 / CBS 148.51 / DSM 1962 / NBRC 6347 / NRRL 1970) TaxID=306901 RepID=Q2H558_CHAGB|nr:uncharacterized protein CHGG_06207 [Chaetomium globosum CBS 148.51]EAQ89588.1 predicted protein [Chaetomium globosum CBS 148.51]